LESGVALLPLSITLFVVSLFTGRMVRRLGARWRVVVGFALLALGLLLLSRIDAGTTPAQMAPSFIVIGLGLGIGFSPTSSVGMGALPQERAGEASGVVNMSRYLGGAFGIALATLVYSSVSVSRLNEALAGQQITGSMQTTLDGIMSGAIPDGATALAGLPANVQSAFLPAAKTAILDGFTASVTGLAVAALIGAFAWWLLMSPVRQRQELTILHRHHARRLNV
jgi:MFS family permease